MIEAEILLRGSTAITMIVYGVHQILRPVSWFSYVPGWLVKILPMKPETFMKEHGVGNALLGLLLLFNVRPEFTYWVVLVWWLSILPFAFYEDWRNGMRDIVIIAGITALITLTL